MMNFRLIAAIAVAWLLSTSVQAQHYMAGDIHIEQAYARATVPGQPVGAVYLSMENSGDQTDRLVKGVSPVAASTEIHAMTRDGNIMKMREVDGIELKPEARIEMKPGGGYHLMLNGLKQPLKAGEKFPLTLFFEKAGKLDMTVPVEAIQSKPGDHSRQHRH